MGLTLSEYLRLALIHLAEEKQIPFKVKSDFRKSGPQPRRVAA